MGRMFSTVCAGLSCGQATVTREQAIDQAVRNVLGDAQIEVTRRHARLSFRAVWDCYIRFQCRIRREFSRIDHCKQQP